MNASEFVDRLEGVIGKAPRWRALCPCHKSKNKTRTLLVTEKGDGIITMHCFAGCSVVDITSAVGVSLHDLFPKSDHGKPTFGLFTKSLAASMQRDLLLCWVFINDIAAGRDPKPGDKAKAKECARRLSAAYQSFRGAS